MTTRHSRESGNPGPHGGHWTTAYNGCDGEWNDDSSLKPLFNREKREIHEINHSLAQACLLQAGVTVCPQRLT